MKPVGSSGIRATEPKKNSVASSIVFQRFFMLQVTPRRYQRIQAGSGCSLPCGFRR
jgi:hypothetical protein